MGEMTVEEYNVLLKMTQFKYTLFREDALDYFHSIISLLEEHFIQNDKVFKAWLDISFETLKNNFRTHILLKKINVIQEYIKEKSFLCEEAFVSIQEMIIEICNLKSC